MNDKRKLYLDGKTQVPSTIHTDSIEHNNIVFCAGNMNMFTLCSNGDILVKGKKVVNDIEVYEAFKEWMNLVR